MAQEESNLLLSGGSLGREGERSVLQQLKGAFHRALLQPFRWRLLQRCAPYL